MFMKLLPVGLLAGAVVNAGMTLPHLPAFDAEARRMGLIDSWRVPAGEAHYDRGHYLFQIAYGYVNAYDSVFLAIEAGEDSEEDDFGFSIVFDRANEAEELLQESINLDPANAHAWAAMGQAQSFLGEFEAARHSMKVSWELAPNNVQLAEVRLDFALSLDAAALDDPEEIDGLTDQEWSYVENDVRVLEAHGHPRDLVGIEEIPTLLNQLDEP